MLAAQPVAGVDVGKSFLDLGFQPAAKACRVANDPVGVSELVAALRRRGVARVALEAIGSYAWPVTAALVAAGFEVGLADPRQVRAFRAAEGRIAKTDRLDAGLIARFARVMPERLRPAPAPQALALKALSTRRRQLVELVAMERTRLGQAFDAAIAEGHRTVIAALEAACKQVEARLEAAIAADPALARRRASQFPATFQPGFFQPFQAADRRPRRARRSTGNRMTPDAARAERRDGPPGAMRPIYC